MFAHNKRLMYTVRVSEPNPTLGSLMLEQFGGPQGAIYCTQSCALFAEFSSTPSA